MKPKILIVDDDQGTLASLSRALALEGYTAVTASSGTRGLEKLAEEAVDAVLSDVVMPEMDGLEFLARVKEKTPAGFARIQYIEQPTARDLKANRANVMHEASRIRPVVIDESLLDLESLLLAREMGYTGAALKACKGQSQSLLLAAAAQKYGMFLCVQDLTCPGASLIHSAGMAAHVPGVAAIESNARQYVPAANMPWQARFPGVFRVSDGTIETGALTGLGLGAT